MRVRVAFVLVLGALAAVAAGCGGSDEVAPTAETVEGTVPAETGTTTEETTTEETTTEETTTAETTTGGGGEGDAAAGKEVFASAGCGSCHTLADAGSSGTIGPNLDEAKPDTELVVERVTDGAGVMPSFKGQLTDQQIQDVAAYVSSVAGA